MPKPGLDISCSGSIKNGHALRPYPEFQIAGFALLRGLFRAVLSTGRESRQRQLPSVLRMFNWNFSFDANGQLRAGLFISLVSVWLLVGVFSYLNYYTRRKYF